MQANSRAFVNAPSVTTTANNAGTTEKGGSSKADVKRQLSGLDFDSQQKLLEPPPGDDPKKGGAAKKPTPGPKTTAKPADKAQKDPGYRWDRGANGTESDPIRRKVGNVSIKYLATRNSAGKFETPKEPKVLVNHDRVNNVAGAVYDDYFEVTIHREVARPDGDGYETKHESGVLDIAAVGSLINTVAATQKEKDQTLKGTPYWVIRVMRWNPIFQISDNILHDKEIETGKPRTGAERVLNCVSAVGDIVSMGAGKAKHVAQIAHGVKAAAGLAKDLNWIGDWVAGFIQGVAGLASIQGSGLHRIEAWMEGRASTLAQNIAAGIKGLDAAATALDVSKVILMATEPMVWAGVAMGLLSKEQGDKLMDLAKAQNAVMESLGVFKAIVDLRKS
jgi:hypothetical protein